MLLTAKEKERKAPQQRVSWKEEKEQGCPTAGSVLSTDKARYRKEENRKRNE